MLKESRGGKKEDTYSTDKVQPDCSNYLIAYAL